MGLTTLALLCDLKPYQGDKTWRTRHPANPTARVSRSSRSSRSFPTIRSPKLGSSSAKRLMPQLQVKGPTLRRWGTKLAVAVDLPFFETIGGPTSTPSRDLNDGDIVWLVPRITDDHRLAKHHWEVLSLEASNDKLLSAETVKRHEFEAALRGKLQRIGGKL